MPQFVRDVEEIRERAIHKIEDGPVTEAYKGNKDRSIEILNEALATEIVCVLRYMHHYFMATGLHGKSVSDEFKEHADAERNHADAIAERIQQLGGKPDFNPRSLMERSASQYVEGETLAEMIREDLIAERVVIEVYSEMIRYFAYNDPTTRVLMEAILKDEEEHASDLANLLYIVDPGTGATEGQDPGTNPLEIKAKRSKGGDGASGQEDQRRPKKGGGGSQEMQPQLSRMERANRREQASKPVPGGRRDADQAPEAVAGRGSAVPPAHQPGASGRPTRVRPQQFAEVETERELPRARAGGQQGESRSVRISKPNRKKKVA